MPDFINQSLTSQFLGCFMEISPMKHFSCHRVVIIVACVLAVLLLVPANAHAMSCSVSMPPIVFGNVNVVAGAAVSTTSTATVNCNGLGSTGARICISIGAGSTSDSTSRLLIGPSGATVRYDLYTDSAHTQLWGSWQTGYDGGGVQVDMTGHGKSTLKVPIYAKLFGSQQGAIPGSYLSTFTADLYIQYGRLGSTPCPTGGSIASFSTSATATVLSACNVSAQNINFGTVGFLASTTDANGTITVQCDLGLPYTVSLNGGNSGATDPTLRQMSSSGNRVTYGLYQDSARSQPWGNTAGSNTVAGVGTGSLQTLTVYGRIPAQATPAPGTYTDTIVVTVGY